VLAFLAVAAVINYLHRYPLSVAEDTIRDDLGLSLKEMGWVMGSAFGIPYAVAQIGTGWLGFRWGTRRAFSLYALVWSSLAGLTALARGFPSLVTLRAGLGVAQSGAFPCTANILSKWFPVRRRALAAGIMSCAMPIGAAIAAALTGVLLQWMSWRLIFAIYFVPGALWAVVFYFWFRDRPEDHPSTNEAEAEIIRGHRTPERQAESEVALPPAPSVPWVDLARNPAIWALSAQQLFRGLGFYFFVSWFPKFLKQTEGIDTKEAGLLASIPLIMDMVGRLLGGASSDWVVARTGSRWLGRSGVAGGSLLLCALCFSGVGLVDGALSVTLVISVGAMLAGMSSPCSHAVSMDIGLQFTAVVFAVMNAIGSLDAFSPVIVAHLVEDYGVAWESIPLFFAGVYVAAAVSWFLLNPNRTLEAGARRVLP
jgi:sugar phosphate permease